MSAALLGLALFLAGSVSRAAAPAEIAQQFAGKQIWYQHGCFRCHPQFVRAAEPVVKRFRNSHDPSESDLPPGRIEHSLLSSYAVALTDGDVRLAVEWADAAWRTNRSRPRLP